MKKLLTAGAEVRPDLAPYVVVVKRNRPGSDHLNWVSVAGRSIEDARNNYDAGRSDIVHQRLDGGHSLLLDIPRSSPCVIDKGATFAFWRTVV